jgi:hypothetical protein
MVSSKSGDERATEGIAMAGKYRTVSEGEGVREQLSLPMQRLLDFERFYLHDIDVYQNLGRDPAFDAGYLPQNCGAFNLPCFLVPAKHFYIYGRRRPCGNEFGLVGGEGMEQTVLLPIHPTALQFYGDFLARTAAVDARDAGIRIWAIPTASTRTLLAWPDRQPEKARFLKTTLHSPIFGDRHLHLRTVGRSIGSSLLVQECGKELPIDFSYFPERVGFVPRTLKNGGFVARSIPEDVQEGRIALIPLFALLGQGPHRAPLITTLMESASMKVTDFIENVLCRPFARLWVTMVVQHGLLLEAHAQDLLLAFSSDFSQSRGFFYRDFEGLQVDWEIRRYRNLPAPKGMPCEWCWHETYETLGHRQTQLAWYKWYLSLFNYVDFVLHELDISLCRWRAEGLFADHRVQEDHATIMFSEHLIDEIERAFGVNIGTRFNICRSPKRFAILLMKLRKDLLSDGR